MVYAIAVFQGPEIKGSIEFVEHKKYGVVIIIKVSGLKKNGIYQ